MMLRACKFRFFKTDRGVTMVEFALVLPLLLMLVIGIIDISRYFAYQAILNKGAESGLNFALKVPNLDVDLSEYQPGDIDYQRYQQARTLVMQRATDIPLRTFFSDSTTTSIAQLVNYNYNDPGIVPDPNNPPPELTNAGLLFPGETLTTSDSATISHKTLPTRPTQQTKEALLKSHPVIVELRAMIKPLTPFMPEITIQARSMGFREEIPRGPLTGEFGLVDPVGSSSSSSSAGTTTTTTLLPPHTAEEPDLACVPDWGTCSVTSRCPNVNIIPALPPSCSCTTCTTLDNPGEEKLGL